MYTAEEMYHWSVEDTRDNVIRALPIGWSLDVNHDGPRRVFSCEVKDPDGNVTWSEEHSDLKLLLLDLYGHIAIRQAPTVSPAWSRPREAAPVVQSVMADGAPSVPDPEDLDPDEISNLYRTL